MKLAPLVVGIACAACSAGPGSDGPRDSAPGVDTPAPGDGGPSGLPAPIQPSDFDHALDKAYIRAPQTWIGDAAFETKWVTMLATPIDMLGGADSAFHADLGSRAVPLPGGEVLCHGDSKLDNFGWIETGSVFSDIDFDDAGACPAAADILHFLVATELEFSDPALDAEALSAYIDTLAPAGAVIAIDPATLPVWADARATGVDKATKNSKLELGGEVQVATSEEIAAVTALAGSDARFPTTVLDIARDVKTDGGSAGLRRFWVLAEDAQHPRTITELKELSTPGTEFGPHSVTYDDASRFDVMKPFWWGAPALGDHFAVQLLGARFVARDRFSTAKLKPADLSVAQRANVLEGEASLLAAKHRAAWAGVNPAALRTWLAASATTVSARWRACYTASGGA